MSERPLGEVVAVQQETRAFIESLELTPNVRARLLQVVDERDEAWRVILGHQHRAEEMWGLLEMVDAHYSGSLDHQPAYVKAIRRFLDDEDYEI